MTGRWAWAEVDLGAIAHNIGVVRAAAAPSAVWAVVKANGYGHGAVPVARAALGAGATGRASRSPRRAWSCVHAGIEGRIIVLSEQPPDLLPSIVRDRLELTVYSAEQLRSLAAAGAVDHPVHLKIDTGMHRVGARPADAVALAQEIDDCPATRLAGVLTHFAVADEPDDPYTATQWAVFERVLDEVGRAGIVVEEVHAANSAGALAHPARGVVRAPPASPSYGLSPGPGVDHLAAELRPAMSLRARSRSSSASQPAPGSRTACDIAWRRTRRSPRCRSATPMECRGGCTRAGARSSSVRSAARSSG